MKEREQTKKKKHGQKYSRTASKPRSRLKAFLPYFLTSLKFLPSRLPYLPVDRGTMILRSPRIQESSQRWKKMPTQHLSFPFFFPLPSMIHRQADFLNCRCYPHLSFWRLPWEKGEGKARSRTMTTTTNDSDSAGACILLLLLLSLLNKKERKGPWGRHPPGKKSKTYAYHVSYMHRLHKLLEYNEEGARTGWKISSDVSWPHVIHLTFPFLTFLCYLRSSCASNTGMILYIPPPGK